MSISIRAASRFRSSSPNRRHHSPRANAPGGAYSYLINGRMIAGFAMVAYPAQYGDSGIMSFIINQNGKVYEKDLGKNSGTLGLAMTSFDPGVGWKETPAPN